MYLLYKLLMMPDGGGALGGPAPEAETVESTEAAETETTTPEEVAEILHLPKPTEPKAEEAEEEKPDESTEEETTDDDNAEESEESEPEVPAAKSTPEPTTQSEFTLEVVDANDVTHKIEKIEDLPKDFEPQNNRQIMEILHDLSKLEASKAQHEADEAKVTQEAEQAKTVENTLKGWETERKELNIVEDTRYDEVMKYMSEQNDIRQKDNKPLIQTVEHALLGLEKQEAKAADEKAKADAKETARKNGGLVGGSSAPASSSAPVYKAGSARNVNDAIKAMGLL